MDDAWQKFCSFSSVLHHCTHSQDILIRVFPKTCFWSSCRLGWIKRYKIVTHLISFNWSPCTFIIEIEAQKLPSNYIINLKNLYLLCGTIPWILICSTFAFIFTLILKDFMSNLMQSSIPGSLGRGFYLQNKEWLPVISMIYSHIVIPNDQFILIKGLGSAIMISFPSNNWPTASAPWRPTYPAASLTFPK